MSRPWFHLAQVNVARAIAPLDDPGLAGFVAKIGEVNAAAEAAEGFVWRYLDDEDAPDEPGLLFNLSIWTGPEALKAYVWGARHAPIMRRRAEWFKAAAAPSLAMWWLPAGERPRPAEALERLAFLERHGPTEAAFDFRNLCAPPEAPDADGEPGTVRYDRRRFAPVLNSANGDVAPGTVFDYRQDAGRIWARYSGPSILFGALVAASGPGGVLDMRYRHFSPEGELRAGRCRTTPETLPDGRLRLHEQWQWTTGDRSSGQSTLEETA